MVSRKEWRLRRRRRLRRSLTVLASAAVVAVALIAGLRGLAPTNPFDRDASARMLDAADRTSGAGNADDSNGSGDTDGNAASEGVRSALRGAPDRVSRSDGRTTPATARPAPESAPSPVTVAEKGSGVLVAAPGHAGQFGTGRVVRYRVEVEDSLPWRPADVARVVDATLADRRSWAAAGRARFERVSGEKFDLRIVIASPDTTDKLCAPLGTGGELSCRMGDHVAINARRWAGAVPAFGGDVLKYRRYVVNHEVGHALGESHARCPGPGKPAPVMMQQTKSVGACKANAWPLPSEL
ncbi:Protein of unknown function [Actinopolymorpha cephalotaxi]|uniref:DUF3152 domain-containing protein n=1 Tax=Actinopolymorpha cephalotaxi TaxID=504797 RepID=A0A1I3B584_9ACTN|nr:DUF3152 domain-containing protein [Actinopolymorpha cephalotaxi]NYH81254.1 hypothetical protein [Actinopolymorpha cephalotaxi]SFH57392.1 Protein of unknown function [Actinopolymorpha cephalotaxi]